MDKNNRMHYSYNMPNCSCCTGDEHCDTDRKKKCKKCITSIICDQAQVSHCEAELFCAVSDHLRNELCKCRNTSEILNIVDSISHFLQASACKEKSIAEVIAACNYIDPYESNDYC